MTILMIFDFDSRVSFLFCLIRSCDGTRILWGRGRSRLPEREFCLRNKDLCMPYGPGTKQKNDIIPCKVVLEVAACGRLEHEMLLCPG